MTMIVPAGNNKLDWSPKATKLQKTASGEQQAQDVEVDALYEAAKGVVEASKKDKSEKCEKCQSEPCKCDKQEKKACDEVMKDDEAVVLDVEETPETFETPENTIDEVSNVQAKSVSEAVAEVETKAEQAEAVVEQVEQAVQKIEDAVQEVKAVCGKDGAVEEVEIEVDEVSGENKIPGEQVVDSEVIVEGDEASMDKSASAEEFCKYAKLSQQNRKKLNDYWTNMLGYPKDFVNLMTKDYEK